MREREVSEGERENDVEEEEREIEVEGEMEKDWRMRRGRKRVVREGEKAEREIERGWW